MCSFRSPSLFRIIPKYINVYFFNLSFLYLFLFFFLSSNYYCHVFFSFSVHYGIFFSASIFQHFLIPFLIVSAFLIAAMSSIKMGIPISILPYKLHITFSPIFVIFAVIAQGIMDSYVVPYFTTFLISIFFVSLCTGLAKPISQ